jgi:hypothetical protein
VRALLVIADIGGYTQFMKLHRMSTAHAQENTDRLLRAVIDAAPRLRLVDLEGDAAFFYVSEPEDEEVASTIAGLAAAMQRAFRERRQRLEALSVCFCEACEQIGRLRVKFVSHLGDVVRQSGRRSTKIAGVDVILVHRMLKNDVPVPEYLLMTDPVVQRVEPELVARTHSIEQELEGLGPHTLHYLDLEQLTEELPPPPRPRLARKLLYTAGMVVETLPAMVGLRR